MPCFGGPQVQGDDGVLSRLHEARTSPTAQLQAILADAEASQALEAAAMLAHHEMVVAAANAASGGGRREGGKGGSRSGQQQQGSGGGGSK